MKVLLPVSGCLDSSVLLVETLRYTDHEVTALHLREDYDSRSAVPGLRDRERRAAARLVKWCSENIRPVSLVYGEVTETDPQGRPFPADETLPVREGFAERRPVRWQRCKWSSLGLNAERLQPDQVWAGLNSWDMRRDAHWWNLRTEDYYSRTSVPLRLPMVIENDPKVRNPPPNTYIGPGRLHNMHRLPEELWSVIVACKASDEAPCGTCVYCATRLFYDRFCRGKPLADVLQIEEAVERIGCYGRWAEHADPETWTHGGIFKMMLDHDRWESVIETPRRPSPAAAPGGASTDTVARIVPIAIPEFDRRRLIADIDANAERESNSSYLNSGTRRLLTPAIGQELLERMRPAVQRLVPDRIVPRRSYARLVPTGAEMGSHIDRLGESWVVTINVHRDRPWDIEICDGGVWRSFALDDPAEGLLFAGRCLPHRRKPYTGEKAYQLFLCYASGASVLPSCRQAAVYRAKALNREEIATIRSFAEGLPGVEATVRNKLVDPGIRTSTVRWLKPAAHGKMAWLFERVESVMRELNERHFGFHVEWGRAIDLQFTEYRPGHFYGPHEDMAMEAQAELERKLSCSILLSEPAEHQGGDLIVNNKRLTPGKQSAPGTLIAFPSYVSHEVTPVTAGTRYSLVAWYMGPLWR